MLPSHRESASDRYRNFVSFRSSSQHSRRLTAVILEAQAQQMMPSPGLEIDMRRPVNPLTLNRGTSYGSSKRAFTFPDGEVIEISDDEDDGIGVVSGIPSQQRPQTQQSPSLLSNVAPRQLQSATVVSTGGPNPRQVNRQVFLEEIEYVSDEEQTNETNAAQGRYSPMDIDNTLAPFANGAAGPSGIGLGHHPIPGTLVGSGPAAPVAFNSAGRAINLTIPYQPIPTSGNRPNVKRKRYVLDDFIIELTDDEEESPNPSTSSSSQHLTQGQKRVKHELPSGSLTYTSIPAMPLRPLAPAPPSNSCSYVPQPEPQIPGAWPGQYPVPAPSNFSHSGGSSNLPAVGSFPGTGLPPLASAPDLFSQSGFHLNYDDQSPVRRIDIGGGGHTEKWVYER
jgi:hypothetical protein